MIDLTGSFVLPADAVLQPLDELPDAARRQLGSRDGDVALSRANSRNYTKLIDPDAAELVKEFGSGCTIAQAIARFSKGKHADAERMLEIDALPMLHSLIAAGLSVPADSNETLRRAPLFAGAPCVNGWEIVRCVQALDDTDVYQVRRDSAASSGPSNSVMRA